MPRPSILEAANAHIAWLESLGVSAVLSSADLVPPGVLIAPPTYAPTFGRDSVDLTWTLTAVAADTVRGPALADLSALLDQLADAYPGQWTTATPATVDYGGDLGQLPAYRITLTQRLENTP